MKLRGELEMRTLFIAGCALALGLSIAQAEVGEEIRSLCEKEWPDEFSMQEFCIKEETASHRALERVKSNVVDGHPVGQKIFRKCLREWSDDLTEWSMVKYCVDEEIGSYNRLHPDNPIDLD
jgi:hypothetical protein